MIQTHVLDLLSTTVLLLNQDGGVQECNTAAQELLGRSKRHILGQMAISLFEHDADLAQSIHLACIGVLQGRRQGAVLSRPRDHVEVSLTTMSLVQQPWAAIIEIKAVEHRVVIDRTQRLIDEINTQHALLSNLAHEIKNPLGGLRGAAQLLEAELPDQRLTEYTQVIISEADRLQALVDRLAVPQTQPREWESLNIHEVCDRVAALIQAEFPSVKLTRDYDASIPNIRGDSQRLVQALLNVARNAAQELTTEPLTATPHIVIRTRVARRVALRNRQHKLAVVVSVIDNGPGVPESLHDRIFHPLVTGREGGSGLGLSIAQDLVQQHGGVIEFDSRAQCTEFRMMLPLEQT
jgi:two-component system nitrogen regulation sensor histidine kinase GlnL